VIVALTLFSYAALTGYATRWLRRAWAVRAPGLGIALWQFALVTIIVTTLLGLLALTVPVAASTGLTESLHACIRLLRAGYRSPLTQWTGFLGLGAAVALLLRIASVLAKELISSCLLRRRHLEALSVLGRPDPDLGITVIEHPSPSAYCVPGRRRRIVLTTAALAALDSDQIRSVLAHEQAHLAGRHDLVLSSARALARAVPLPLFKNAVNELSTLVEMLADDAVATSAQRVTLATALVSIATNATPPAPMDALAATGTCVAARVERLMAPVKPLPRLVASVVALSAVVVAVAPIAIVIAPAVTAATRSYCPIFSA
jgi:Zn-dependent protease with chaperone function